MLALLASSHEVNSSRNDQGRVRYEAVSRWGARRKVDPAIHDLPTRASWVFPGTTMRRTLKRLASHRGVACVGKDWRRPVDQIYHTWSLTSSITNRDS